MHMNKLSTAKRAAVVAALVEGNSIRATVRMTQVSKPTILKLLAQLGAACWNYHNDHVRRLRCKRVECDEIWQFCYSKEKNIPKEKLGQFGYGNVWTWTALDSDSKLIVSWCVGGRDAGTAYQFMQDVAARINTRIQMTTDGYRKYISAVEDAFGTGIDYAMLTKMYGKDTGEDTRYSPAKVLSTTTEVIKGNPDPDYISTSYVERQNLTMRMHMRRFTRLTNAFSKKVENHMAAVALHFVWYNFVRVHQTLRVTPAMEAGLSDHVWSIEELAGLLDAADKKAA
jgi:IS1 family transposase